MSYNKVLSFKVFLFLAVELLVFAFLIARCSTSSGVIIYLPYILITAPFLIWAICSKLETLGLVLLILAITLSPRFPVGQLAHGRAIDIRVEDILLILLLIAWLVKIKSRPFQKTPIFYPIIVYLGVSLLSTLLGLFFGWIDPAESFFHFLKEVEYFLIFLLVANNIIDKNQIKLLVGVFLTVGVADFGYKILQLTAGVHLSGYGSATFFESGSMQSAMVSLCALAIALSLWNYQKSRVGRMGLIVLVLLFTAALFLPGSRSFTLGGLGALLVAALWLNGRKVASPFLLFLPIIAFLTLRHFFPQLGSLMRESDIPGGITSLQQVRVPIYINSLKRFFLRSPLLGCGSATFPTAGSGAHNFYVSLLCQGGVMGFFAYMWMWGKLGKNIYQSFRTSSDNLYKTIVLSWLLVTVGIIIANFFGAFLKTVRIAELYWFLSGMSIGVIKLGEMETEKAN